jgi:hypothetical protein
VSTTLKRVHGYLAEFDSVKELYHAAEKVNEAGYNRWDVHSPFPIHGMDHAMGVKRSKLPWLVFFGGAAGTTTAFLLAIHHSGEALPDHRAGQTRHDFLACQHGSR